MEEGPRPPERNNGTAPGTGTSHRRRYALIAETPPRPKPHPDPSGDDRSAVVTDPLPVELPFVLATGIECSAPVVAGGLRHDQLLATGHWTRFAEDARLVRALGIPFLRYGIPFHVVAREPGRLDWEWTDRALEELREQGIAPIADLLHFGVPDDLAGIGDPRLAGRYLAFVEAFVERYPWVRWFTPVNEPLVTAMFSGRRGYWNERGTSDETFVRALDSVLECAVRGAAVIRQAHPEAVIVQSDGCETFRPAAGDAAAEAQLRSEQAFLGFDLTLGRLPEPAVLDWLGRSGMDERRVAWFMEHAAEPPFIVGLDYYHGNEWLVRGDGTAVPDPAPLGFGGVAGRWLDRYGLPVMLAETNMVSERAVAWMDACWEDAMRLRAQGRPLVGFCWYSLTDQVDWDIALREFRGRVNPLGLVDLSRRLRPAGRRYAELAELAVTGRIPAIGGQPPAIRVA